MCVIQMVLVFDVITRWPLNSLTSLLSQVTFKIIHYSLESLFICLCVRPLACPFACLLAIYVCLFVCLFACLSFCLFVCTSYQFLLRRNIYLNNTIFAVFPLSESYCLKRHLGNPSFPQNTNYLCSILSVRHIFIHS